MNRGHAQRAGPFRCLALGALLGLSVGSGACLRTHTADMYAKIDELGLSERYEYSSAYEDGGKPVLFGDHPKVTRAYRSPDDLATTCADLEALLANRSPTITRHDNACHLRFPMRPSPHVLAQLEFSYGVLVTAIRPTDPGEAASLTWVHVRVEDRGL